MLSLLAGGVVVQTNPLYTERELEYQLYDSEATKIILYSDLLYPRAVKMKALKKMQSTVQHIIVTAIQVLLAISQTNEFIHLSKRKQHEDKRQCGIHTDTIHLF